MIELKDLKKGDVYESENTASEIVNVGKDFIVTLCLKGTGKGEERERFGGELRWYLHWLNSKTVRKAE